jgi:hypothetical protein
MNSVTCHVSISLDGFVAGPNQSIENPIGEGGMRLHQWMFEAAGWREQHGLDGGERTVDADVVDELVQGFGAYFMGRNMFSGGDGSQVTSLPTLMLFCDGQPVQAFVGAKPKARPLSELDAALRQQTTPSRHLPA